MFEVVNEKNTLDPRTCLFLSCVISLICMTGNIEGDGIYVRLVVLILPSILLILIRKYMIGFIVSVLMIISWSLEIWLGHIEHNFIHIILFLVVSIITRFFPSVFMGYYMLKTIEVDHLVRSLEVMKLPKLITIPIAVMFRFIPTILIEYEYIKNAMVMKFAKKHILLMKPLEYLTYGLIPILNSVVKISNELIISALTRGLDSRTKKTSIISLKLKTLDYLMILFTCIVVILNIVV
ncbi:Transmembrane component of energizing module of predicted ECF transporter [Mammaliicoccus lentus]|uniref:energy-coupling factor transporter transmembrane component T n=1 Tax=Mammaliicoccus lentus TaxID=42858 RepID=UPI0039EA16F0